MKNVGAKIFSVALVLASLYGCFYLVKSFLKPGHLSEIMKKEDDFSVKKLKEEAEKEKKEREEKKKENKKGDRENEIKRKKEEAKRKEAERKELQKEMRNEAKKEKKDELDEKKEIKVVKEGGVVAVAKEEEKKEEEVLYKTGERGPRVKGLLSIDYVNSSYVVTLGVKDNIGPGSLLGVYDSTRRVGTVEVEYSSEGISYVKPVSGLFYKSGKRTFKVLVE